MKIAATPSTLTQNQSTRQLPTMTSRVDPEGARRMMEMLVNLYSDRRLAVVREYTSNAVDASRVAGTTIPVDITIPTALESNLVITDRGTGMSMAEVEATYLAFAASTKRDSDDLVGGLGVGAKSAWALAESFLVDTVKDGERTIVRAARDLSHQVLMAGERTSLPNGTTVSIPIDLDGEQAEWSRVIMEVATAHAAGTVTVNGAAVPSLANGKNQIGPIICAQVPNHGTGVMIRSGGTLFESVYAVTSRVRRRCTISNIVIELPIGSFDHTPSREQVIATERTYAAVNAALDVFEVELEKLSKQISSLVETDVPAAIRLREEILGESNTKDYNVLPIKAHVSVPHDIGAWVGGKAWRRVGPGETDVFTATSWGAESGRTILVTGVPAGRKLRNFATYVKNHFPSVRRIIPIPAGKTGVAFNIDINSASRDRENQNSGATDQQFVLEPSMVSDSHVFTYERWLEVSATQRATRGPRAGYKTTVWEKDTAGVLRSNEREMTAADLAAATLPVFYTDNDNDHRARTVIKPCICVHLNRRSPDALLKHVPQAMTVYAWQKQCVNGELQGLTKLQQMALAVEDNYGWKARFTLLSAARKKLLAQGGKSNALLDSSAEIMAAIDGLDTNQRAVWRALRNLAVNGVQDIVESANELDNRIKEAWPLLRHASDYSRRNSIEHDHYLAYIMAVPLT